MLVWTKPGSVHLWAERQGQVQWEGIRNLNLEAIGNFAGANALAPCIGMSSDGLPLAVVVLTS
jgi:hypothetical protein